MQIVFAVFSPSLMFANLAKTVTLQDVISWYALGLQKLSCFLQVVPIMKKKSRSCNFFFHV